ncbi:MAG TPA: DsbC family protein [Casimicrobiaceae bacterium]|nr:DsbC family protein [Casimicrobiaceae bacterium]
MVRHSAQYIALTLAASLALAGSALAQTPAPGGKSAPAKAGSAKAASGEVADAAAIKKLMEEKFPGASVSNIVKSPYAGLYEVQFDDQLVYTDAKVSYVFVGAMYDANSKKNLTEEKLRKLTRVAWDSLPLELAMKKVKGNGQRKLAVFADADCPFCARLENELKNVDNVTIYTFVYPIDQLHPDAARKTRIIWCAPDRVAAWDAWFANKTLPDNAGDCETPLAKTYELGQKLHINATPTLVFADGSMIPGALPGPRLETEMNQAEAEAAKLASEAGKAQKPAGATAKATSVN